MNVSIYRLICRNTRTQTANAICHSLQKKRWFILLSKKKLTIASIPNVNRQALSKFRTLLEEGSTAMTVVPPKDGEGRGTAKENLPSSQSLCHTPSPLQYKGSGLYLHFFASPYFLFPQLSPTPTTCPLLKSWWQHCLQTNVMFLVMSCSKRIGREDAHHLTYMDRGLFMKSLEN